MLTSSHLNPRAFISAVPQAQEGSSGRQEAGLQNAIKLLDEAQSLSDAQVFQQAGSRIQSALSILDSLPEGDSNVVFAKANGYALLGNIADANGDPGKAFRNWQIAMSLYDKIDDKRTTANFISILERMGKALADQGRTDEALKSMRRVDELEVQSGASDEQRAQTKSNVGVLLHRLGRDREAEEVLRKAVELGDTAHISEADEGKYLFHLAMAEAGSGDSKSAIEHCERALAILAPLQHTELQRTQILLIEAEILLDDNQRDAAHNKVLAAQRLVPEATETGSLRAEILMELARTTLDDTDESKADALADYQAALALLDGLDGEEENKITCLENIGALLYKTGKLSEAIEIYRSTLSKYQEQWSTLTSSSSGRFYRNFGLMLVRSGQVSEGLDNLVLALSADWSGAVSQIGSMTQKQILWKADELYSDTDLIYTLSLASPEKTAAKAYNVLLLTKDLYSELNRIRLRRMLESGSPEIVEDRNRYLELRRQLSRRTLDSSHSEVSVSTDIMAQLAQEANEREQDLVSKIGPENPNSTSPVRVEEVLSRLKPGELLLDYFSYLRFDLKTMTTAEQRYAAFVLDGTTGSARLIDLGEANPIVTAVDAFRECEKSQSDPANPSLDEDQLATFGQNLRRLVLDPLLPTQFHLNRLYVASDSILGEIPFDALPSAKAADGWHYLVEDTDVIHLSTGRDLARVRSARSTSKEAWLLGDPDFEATPNQRVLEFNKAPDAVSGEIVQARKQGAEKPALMGSFIPSGVEDDTRIPSNWPRLESTALLVSAAAQQAEKAGMTPTILLRAAASEESLSRMISPRFVLISTHGYFVKGEPPVHFEGSIHFDSSDQAISVASRSQMFGEKNANASIVVDNEDFWETFDPLHRSMLILAGANNRVHHEVRYLSRGRLLTEEKLSNQTNPGPRDEREISDGLLTAYKILGLDMTSTELVILAGCESGLGVTSEDRSPGLVHRSAGVMGLRQAFTIAGASSVVTSMWEVPLDQTVDQLQSFMDAWLIHRRARYQAFRESQLAALRAARINGLGGHPFWWGGFVYYGDPGDR